MEDFEKNYEAARKKYPLPKFDELDIEFDIHCIDDGKFPLREVRLKICERIDDLCGMLEEVLQPDTKVSNLYESRVFAESDKELIFIVFKKLMAIRKKAALISLRNNEMEEAEFIAESHKQWIALKKQLEPFFIKLVDAWQTDTDIKEQLSYFG